MRTRNPVQLFLGLRQGDVKYAFAKLSSLEKKLQPQGSLASARISLSQKQAVPRNASTKDVIKAGNPCGSRFGGVVPHRRVSLAAVSRGATPQILGPWARPI